MALTPAESDELRFGRDLEMTTDPELTVLPITATGDLRTLAGLPNVKAAAFRRVGTVAGTMVHRPLYGGDTPLFIETPLTVARAADLVTGNRRNLLRDSRIVDAKVGATEGRPTDTKAAAITLDLDIRVQGNDGVERLQITVAEA